MPADSIPTITICTDASVSSEHQIAASAYYIRLPDRVIKIGTVLKTRTKKSSVAEQWAMANALHIVDSLVELDKYQLVLYSDNLDAIGKTLVTKKKKETNGKKYLKFFRDNILSVAEKAAGYEFRHVKGHMHFTDTAYTEANHMNYWCDQEAKRLMRSEVESLGIRTSDRSLTQMAFRFPIDRSAARTSMKSGPPA